MKFSFEILPLIFSIGKKQRSFHQTNWKVILHQQQEQFEKFQLNLITVMTAAISNLIASLELNKLDWKQLNWFSGKLFWHLNTIPKIMWFFLCGFNIERMLLNTIFFIKMMHGNQDFCLVYKEQKNENVLQILFCSNCLWILNPKTVDQLTKIFGIQQSLFQIR